MKTAPFAARTITYARAHKVTSAIVIVVALGGGYWTYKKLNPTPVQLQYTLATVQTGTVISTISGSGQVSPSNQITINPKASGTITRVLVKDGQSVRAGQALAYLDSTDEYNAVQSAKNDLTSAQISLAKTQQPADQLSLTQSQNSLAKAQDSVQSAQTNLATAYSDGFTDISSTFVDMPSIMTSMNTILYGFDSSLGGTSQWNVDYYGNRINIGRNDMSGTDIATNAKSQFDTARDAYNIVFNDYKSASRTEDPAAIQKLLQDTEVMVTQSADAMKTMSNLVRTYEDVLGANVTPPSGATSQLNSINTYTATLNGHISTLQSDLNTITSSQQSIIDANRSVTEDQQSLQKLQSGADPLDLQSAQLSLQIREQALQQAQDNLADYTIVAPIAGVIANLALNVGNTVSSGTSAATEITDQEIAQLSLNEVDVAKISAGQKATLSFDAIPDLSLTGTVADVSPLGTVSQGVVSYAVKIAFDTQDPRVKAGMTVNADIQTAVHTNVLTVPASAVKSQNGASYVQIFQPAMTGADASSTAPIKTLQTPVNVPVTIGITDNTTTEILTGLTAGEQIIRTSTTAATSKTAASGAAARGGLGGGGAVRF